MGVTCCEGEGVYPYHSHLAARRTRHLMLNAKFHIMNV